MEFGTKNNQQQASRARCIIMSQKEESLSDPEMMTVVMLQCWTPGLGLACGMEGGWWLYLTCTDLL